MFNTNINPIKHPIKHDEDGISLGTIELKTIGFSFNHTEMKLSKSK